MEELVEQQMNVVWACLEKRAATRALTAAEPWAWQKRASILEGRRRSAKQADQGMFEGMEDLGTGTALRHQKMAETSVVDPKLAVV